MNEMGKSKRIDTKRIVCPNCESLHVSTKYEERSFSYGDTDAAVEVAVVLPIRVCGDCGAEFADSEAEDAEHEAVCRHLRVMTPTQIRQIREKYGVSQAEFARITRLGEATISRWERGAMIQNGAYDQLMFLLSVPENFDSLKNRFQRGVARSPLAREPVFRCIEPSPALRAHAGDFRLQGSGTTK